MSRITKIAVFAVEASAVLYVGTWIYYKLVKKFGNPNANDFNDSKVSY